MKPTIHKAMAAVTAAAVLTGCGVVTHPDPGYDMKKIDSKLSIIGSGSDTGAIVGGGYPQPYDGADPASDRLVAERCGAKAGVQQHGIEAFAIGVAVDIILDLVVDAAQSELTKYTVAYGDAVTFPNWNRDLVPAATAPRTTSYFYAAQSPLELSWKCFRFVRGPENKDGTRAVEMDFVGQVALTPSRDALLLRPLRLYYGRPAPEKVTSKTGEDNNIGLAIAVSMESTYRASENGRMKTEKLFEKTVLKQQIDTKKFLVKPYSDRPSFRGQVYYYLDAKKTQNLAVVPLPPVPPGGRGPTGYVTMTIQASETSDPGGMTKWLANFAKDKKGDIAKVVKDAITTAAGVE